MSNEVMSRLSELSGDLTQRNKYTLLVDKTPSKISEVPFSADTPEESKGYSGFFATEQSALEAAKKFLGNVTAVTQKPYPGFDKFELTTGLVLVSE